MTDNNPYVRQWRAKGWLPPKQELAFDCADCNSGEPEQCMKASFCQHRDGQQCEVLDEDWLADVIADSLDMDWTPRDGARAILRAATALSRAAESSEPAIVEGERAAKRIGAVEINMNFDVRSLIEEFAPNAPVDDILREMASFASKPAKKAVGQSPAEAMREACAIEIDRWAGPGAYVGDDVTKFVKGIAAMVRAVKLPETGGTEIAEEDRVIGGGVVLYEGGGYTIRKAGDPFPPTADSYVFVPMYDNQLSALAQSSTPPASKGVENARERIAHVVAWEHYGIAWKHMERQSQADVLAMVDRMLNPPTPGNDTLQGRGEVGPDGCFWRSGHDGEGPDPTRFFCEVLGYVPAANAGYPVEFRLREVRDTETEARAAAFAGARAALQKDTRHDG